MLTTMNLPSPFRNSRLLVLLILAGGILCTRIARGEKVVLVADGGSGGDGTPAAQAKLDKPFAVAFDKAGNLYIGEYEGHSAF
jgi:hypothetical protein